MKGMAFNGNICAHLYCTLFSGVVYCAPIMNLYSQTPGERIKLSRQRLGLTQQELADRLNDCLESKEIVERSLISRWEQDKNFPRNHRKTVLEEILSIDLGTPLRQNNSSLYLTGRDEIEQSMLLSLRNCQEIWMTNKTMDRSIWNELDDISTLLEGSRANEACFFREIYYVRTTDDLSRIKDIAMRNYPRYEMRIRVAPGHTLPILLAPKDRFGIILSGFFDDITSVGLALNAQAIGFNEHYLRHIWSKAATIFSDSKFQRQNFAQATRTLQQIGGIAKNEFDDLLQQSL